MASLCQSWKLASLHWSRTFIPEGMSVQTTELRMACLDSVHFPSRERKIQTHQCGQANRYRTPHDQLFSSADSFAMIRGGHIRPFNFRRPCQVARWRFANWMSREN